MPIFEYVCDHCGKIFEKIQRRPQPEIPCPDCAQAAQRKISRPAKGTSSSGCHGGTSSGFT